MSPLHLRRILARNDEESRCDFFCCRHRSNRFSVDTNKFDADVDYCHPK
jgi:hypothetical protein